MTYVHILVYTCIYMHISTPYVFFWSQYVLDKNTSIYYIYVHIRTPIYVHEKNGF